MDVSITSICVSDKEGGLSRFYVSLYNILSLNEKMDLQLKAVISVHKALSDELFSDASKISALKQPSVLLDKFFQKICAVSERDD